MYCAKIMAFVACVSPKQLRKVRSLLATSIDRLELDDRSYFYTPGSHEVHYGDGAVKDILSYRPVERFDAEEAIETTLMLMACEDPDAEKHVFVLVDQMPEARRLSRALRLDDRQRTDCRFHFLDLGEEKPELRAVCEQRSRCDYQTVADVRNIIEVIRRLC